MTSSAVANLKWRYILSLGFVMIYLAVDMPSSLRPPPRFYNVDSIGPLSLEMCRHLLDV